MNANIKGSHWVRNSLTFTTFHEQWKSSGALNHSVTLLQLILTRILSNSVILKFFICISASNLNNFIYRRVIEAKIKANGKLMNRTARKQDKKWNKSR